MDEANELQIEGPCKVRMRCGGVLPAELQDDATYPFVCPLETGIAISWTRTGKFADWIDEEGPLDIVEIVPASPAPEADLITGPGRYPVRAEGAWAVVDGRLPGGSGCWHGTFHIDGRAYGGYSWLSSGSRDANGESSDDIIGPRIPDDVRDDEIPAYLAKYASAIRRRQSDSRQAVSAQAKGETLADSDEPRKTVPAKIPIPLGFAARWCDECKTYSLIREKVAWTGNADEIGCCPDCGEWSHRIEYNQPIPVDADLSERADEPKAEALKLEPGEWETVDGEIKGEAGCTLAIVGFIAAVAMGYGLGLLSGANSERAAAIEAGVGRWDINATTGESAFFYGPATPPPVVADEIEPGATEQQGRLSNRGD